MAMIEMKLDTIYFDLILNKKKIYETRVFDEKRKKLKLRDIIIFSDRGSERTFKAEITELSFFKDFKDAISSAGLKKVMPNVRSIEQAVKLYESFPNYKTGSKIHGVLRFKIRVF